MQHHVIISVKARSSRCLIVKKLVAIYPVSTSKYGLGDWRGSFTVHPLGELEIAQKVGDGMPPPERSSKTVVGPAKSLYPMLPGAIRSLAASFGCVGQEPQNPNAFGRDIYIHGTPEERNLGLPVSYGCVRMSSNDVIKLYEMVGLGAQVTNADAPLDKIVLKLADGTRIASTGRRGIMGR